VAGSGLLGEPVPGKATDVDLHHPTHIVFDDAGRMLIATWFNGKIARHVRRAGFAGDRGPATEALLNRPFGIALDGDDNLYIADSVNHRIRIVPG
jgi:NHL repeat